MDKYDTLEYSRVKATAVSVRLRIYLCAFKNTNIDHIGVGDVGELVALLGEALDILLEGLVGPVSTVVEVL